MGVVPRDTCNGIESAMNPPTYDYWDGKVIRAADGTYHLFADRWLGSNGFNPGWEGSDPIHATGTANGTALGPFTDNGYVYNDSAFGSDPHHGHNSSAVVLNNGTYGFVVSEVVPFTVFTASSLNGPWSPCANNSGAGLSVPNSGFGGNNNWGSNVSLVVRPDGNFEVIQRHGLIALSTSGICGPYLAQQPTFAYPSSETPPAASMASVYPNRQKHSDPLAGMPGGPPVTPESTYTLAEDPVIWYSGGKYHVLYDYPDDRVGYHLTSTDGIHNWTDEGLAYDPRDAQQIFSYTDGTVDHWFKMERPGVVIESGYVTYITFAVSDVDKNDQIPAGSDHGSKVIVLPFDGVAFDCDTGDGGASCHDAGSAVSEGGLDGGASDAASVRDATLDDVGTGTLDAKVAEASGVGTDASSTSTDASSIGPDASGTGTDASGVNADASGLAADASSVDADASGLAADASSVNIDASSAIADAGSGGSSSDGGLASTGNESAGCGCRMAPADERFGGTLLAPAGAVLASFLRRRRPRSARRSGSR
jgi:hypothetical protein